MTTTTQPTTKKSERPGYKVLEFNVSRFLPSMHVFFRYHTIMKEHKFIEDVCLVQKNNELMVRVERIHH